MRLENSERLVMITGTSRGIGRYLAQHYLEAGYRVVGCSRSPVEFELANYQHFCLDISAERDVLNMFAEIRKGYGRLDVLINNASVLSRGLIMMTSSNTLKEVFDTNVFGTFIACRESSKLMRRNSFGRIINISTAAVPLATRGSAVYGASKAAVEQFFRVLANEVAPFGITVNTIGLSFVEGSGMAEAVSEEVIQETLQLTTSKSMVSLGDVAHTLDFLISEGSGMVNNQTLYLGGI